ncbi:unnamed protein product [Closterium sp. NIES-65]|nr:unnamed protein product [Closterium sp. NIES-65]
MATPNVLTFDAEGRAIDFAVWIEDLQLYLLCDAVDEVSLFDFVSGAVPAPPADADSAVRSKWATRDAAARLAVRRHLPSSECAHFSQCKTAQALYDAVVARYSSPSSATLSRLMLPFLFPDLASFPTVADLVTHLRASDTRYRAALPAEFRAANPPPMYITLYFLVTRLPESLRVVRDQGVVPPPCCPLSPLPLRPTSLVLSRSVRRLPPVADAALARARGAREQVEPEGAVEEAVGVEGGVGVAGGVVAGVEVVVAAVEAEVAAEVVAEEAVGAVGATVLVGEVAVATGVAVEAGVAVEEGVGVARPSGAALGVVSASSSSSSSRSSSRSSSSALAPY